MMRRYLRRLLPDHATIRANPWLRPFESSLLHPRLWHLNRHSAAGAVAAGLFCGLIPGPLQMLGAASCALVFRVNLPLSMLVTLYTNPFTIVPLYLLAYQIGRLFLGDGNGFIAPPALNPGDMLAWSTPLQTWLLAVAKPLGIGLVLLATGLAAAGYMMARAAWRIYLLTAWRRRKAIRSG